MLQPTVCGPGQLFIRATVRAARRGVDVKLLLSGAWYSQAENERLVDNLDALVSREGLGLEAHVADPGGGSRRSTPRAS